MTALERAGRTRYSGRMKVESWDPRGWCEAGLSAAREAATLVMEGFRGRYRVQTKAHAELFTEYDVRSEELIRKALAEATPGIAIVGEEDGGTASSELTWFVDPIDGTTNFVAGHPWFAVSVGLMCGKEPIAGAVVAPALGLSWWGWVGGGAWRDGVPCRVKDNTRLSNALISTGFPTRSGAPGARQVQRHARVVAATRDVRRCGSAAIELCLVAEGVYDVYWMRRLDHWDTAAGAAIVLAAGGAWQSHEVEREVHELAGNPAMLSVFKKILDEPS